MKAKKKNVTPQGGMTYREIAKRIGISWQSVRMIEQKALRKLYFKLKDQL